MPEKEQRCLFDRSDGGLSAISIASNGIADSGKEIARPVTAFAFFPVYFSEMLINTFVLVTRRNEVDSGMTRR